VQGGVSYSGVRHLPTALAVNFQEVVHSVPTVNAEVAKQRDSRRTEWTVTRMLP